MSLKNASGKHMIQIISATRHDATGFMRSPLGISLSRLQSSIPLGQRISYSNRRGLSEIYNESIDSASNEDILIFVHDDVWIDDFFLPARVLDGLARFDVLGVAGNSRLPVDHVGWAFREGLIWDDLSMLRGAVAHGDTPFGSISSFGTTPGNCELIDGVFIAARAYILRSRGVRFDPQFAFHFYDIDFCRSARRAGLSLGVWPIALTHNSGGAFGSPPWHAALHLYREKWPIGT